MSFNYYSNIRHASPNAKQYIPPNQKRSSRVTLPFVTILANHPGYVVRDATTGPVLKYCKLPKSTL